MVGLQFSKPRRKRVLRAKGRESQFPEREKVGEDMTSQPGEESGRGDMRINFLGSQSIEAEKNVQGGMSPGNYLPQDERKPRGTFQRSRG